MNIAEIENIVRTQLQEFASKAAVDVDLTNLGITRPKQRQHGDYASNIALRISRDFSLPPLELAQQLAEQLSGCEQLQQVTAVAPGFINFFIREESRQQVVIDVLQAANHYGRQPKKEHSILLEFVSSNPTGPLHVGHGRGAAYGASLANVLRAHGYQVHCEYYLNDAGRQIAILATSLWIRYLQHAGYACQFPTSGYKGGYLEQMAGAIHAEHQHKFVPENFDLQAINTEAETDEQLDNLVLNSQQLLGKETFTQLKKIVTEEVTALIKDDLKSFGVTFDSWFSEDSMLKDNKLEKVLEQLDKAGALYNKDGALWFHSQNYGDSKDRVVRRANGEYTYFATDIAYHIDKFERGFDHAINLFGSDHHGYIARLKAAITALGHDPQRLEICIIQFANLMRGKEKISMSTRSGQFVALSELIEETGVDAARFFYLMRRHEQHLDFDIQLATQQTRDNPVYYVQYAYARVSQIMHQAKTLDLIFDTTQAFAQLQQLEDEREHCLIDKLSSYPDLIQQAAHKRSPYIISQYLRELAALFHHYYAGVKILDATQCWQARLALSLAVQQVLANGLHLLGVSAPEHM